MEGRKFGFRTAANDNFSEANRPRTPEKAPEIDAVRLNALRQKVSTVLETYPFLLSGEKIEEAIQAVSGMTRNDVMRIINKFDPTTLEDDKAHFYKALLNILDEEHIEE